jgi:hypothetical protein
MAQDNMDIRDRNGSLLGTIRRLSDGKLEARDTRGSYTGSYCRRNDETRNANDNPEQRRR